MNQLKLLPNQITAIRLVLIPILWVCAFLGLAEWVGIGLAVAYLTDILDGLVARKMHISSAFGAKLDSLADNLLQPCVLIWLWMLRPAVFQDYPGLWAVAILIYFSSLAVGLIKFRRFGNLHLASSRYGSIILFVFAIYTFLSSQYSAALLILALASSIISSSETLILQLILKKVNEHLGSLILVLARKSPDLTLE